MLLFSYHTGTSAEDHEDRGFAFARTSAAKRSKLASEGNPNHMYTTRKEKILMYGLIFVIEVHPFSRLYTH